MNQKDSEIESRNVTPTHIMGKPIDEVCAILSMLDMERLADMQLTMKNLKEWQKLLAKEQQKIFSDRVTAILEKKKGRR